MTERLTTEDLVPHGKREDRVPGHEQGGQVAYGGPEDGYDHRADAHRADDRRVDAAPVDYDRISDGRVDDGRVDDGRVDDGRVDDGGIHDSGVRDGEVHDNGIDGRGHDGGQVDTRVDGDRFAADDRFDGEPAREPAEGRADVERGEGEALFTTDEAGGYRGEWRALQADFVDDPRDAVRRADELVAQVIQSLATTFAEHKRSLEGQWQEGGQADTEELRLALRRYRSFFDRLLSV